jgi:allantoinase
MPDWRRSVKLPAHNPYDYVPINRRKDYTWPGGQRLAIYFCNNVEYFAFGTGLGSDSTGGTAPQTQRNYAWRDYGNRIGIWRIFDLFDEFACPLAHNLNSMILDHHSEIGERMMQRGDEFVAHGRSNSERQGDMWEQDEALLIAETTETIRRFTGKKPVGWMSPWLSQSTRRSICCRRPATSINATGRSTTNPSGCARAVARSSICRIRSRPTTHR